MALEAGTRAVIERKDRVLVVGPGGRLGAVIFGWLMQASQDAFAGMKHPRGLCGHPKGARLLNSVLSSKFILARAGEDTVYAYTQWNDPEELAVRLMPTNYAVVFEACARVERWQISGEPFEEVWTDGATCAATAVNGAAAVTLEDRAAQLELFAQSAKTAGLEHVVCVLGSGVGTAPADAAAIDRAAVAALAKAGVPFTLVAPRCASLGDMSGWYYRKGIEQRRLSASTLALAGDAAKIEGAFDAAAPTAPAEGIVMVEDLARVVSETLQRNDPTRSRLITLAAEPDAAPDAPAIDDDAFFAGLVAR